MIDWKWMKWLLMGCIIFLPACVQFSCQEEGDTGGGDPGDTLMRYRINEHAIFVNRDACEALEAAGISVGYAKSRNGNYIDLCDEKIDTYAIVPGTKLAYVHLNLMNAPIDLIVDGLKGSKSYNAADRSMLRRQLNNAKMHSTSAYWGIVRKHEHFRKRYREGIPYPEPGSKEAADDELLAKELAEADEKAGYIIDYSSN